jgi:hypothetical protein
MDGYDSKFLELINLVLKPRFHGIDNLSLCLARFEGAHYGIATSDGDTLQLKDYPAGWFPILPSELKLENVAGELFDEVLDRTVPKWLNNNYQICTASLNRASNSVISVNRIAIAYAQGQEPPAERYKLSASILKDAKLANRVDIEEYLVRNNIEHLTRA